MNGEDQRVCTVPDYWWNEAADMMHDANVLLSNGGTRKSVCNYCHGAIKRALKAVLATQCKLGASDTTHSLAKLARRAGILDEVPPQLREYLIVSSGMHGTASYPEMERAEQVWYNDAAFRVYVMNTAKLYKLLVERHCNKGNDDGGEDDGRDQ